MIRALLFASLVACSSQEAAPERGPVYTPTVAYQLHALADRCETAPGAGVVREVRTCVGSRGTIRIDLGAERHVRVLEVTVVVESAWEARHLIEPVLTGIVPPSAIAAMNERLQPEAPSAPEATIDGVKLRVEIVGQRYSVTLTW